MTTKSNKRQKIDRSSTAAYAASQPLFDVFRKATTSISAQKHQLVSARDIVQSLHVKLANGDAERHEAYMNSAIDAWKLATDSYCAILEELVLITSADPTEGRDAGQRHGSFAAMLETAQKAKAVAEQYEANKESEDNGSAEEDESMTEAAARPCHTNAFGKRTAANAADDKPAQTLPQKWSTMLNPNLRHDKTGTKVLWEKGELKVPIESLEANERKAWMIIAGRMRKKARVQKMKAARQNHESSGKVDELDNGQPQPVNGHNVNLPPSEPTIEYEDISAEVEARLKAKEEKKAAEKAGKKEKKRKRKRESGDSFATADIAEDLEMRKAMEEMEMTEQSHGPVRKKSKKAFDNDGLNENAEDTSPAPKKTRDRKDEMGASEKRKKHVVADEGDEAIKKRKKTKA